MSNSRLQRLRADYRLLSYRDHASLTDAELQAVHHLHLDEALRRGLPPSASANKREVAWFMRLNQVDAYVDAHGHVPHENNRRRGDVLTAAALTASALADWLGQQRRPPSKARLSTYQVARLGLLPGFRWQPRAEQWADTYRGYYAFVGTRRRAPAYRSLDRGERRLAAWAAKQRHAHRNGRLQRARVAALEQIPIWTWGAPKSDDQP